MIYMNYEQLLLHQFDKLKLPVTANDSTYLTAVRSIKIGTCHKDFISPSIPPGKSFPNDLKLPPVVKTGRREEKQFSPRYRTTSFLEDNKQVENGLSPDLEESFVKADQFKISN